MSAIILVFGESTNDTRSVISIARILDERLSSYSMSPRRDPVIHLRRDDLPKTRRSVSDAIAKIVRAEEVRQQVAAVIAHQDADAVEPAHEAIADGMEQDLAAASVPQPVAAVPAWELEAWLMLFPEALQKTRACWRTLALGARSTGRIENAKEVLRRALRPNNGRCPDYVESDSTTISQNIDPRSINLNAITLRSDSIARFRAKLMQLTLP